MEEAIIEFVRENTCIYNKQNKNFKNQVLKDKLWLTFANELNTPVDAVKKRWRSMRDHFVRIKKNESAPSGSGQIKENNYKYYPLMKFLDEAPHTNMSTTDNFDEDDVVEYVGEDTSSSSITPEQRPKRKRTVSGVENELLEAVNTIKQRPQKSAFGHIMDGVVKMVDDAEFSNTDVATLQINIMHLVQEAIANKNDNFEISN